MRLAHRAWRITFALAPQARSSGDPVLVDALETELRILELQKRLVVELQVSSCWVVVGFGVGLG